MFAVPGEEGIWFVAMLAMLVVSAGVVQGVRAVTALAPSGRTAALFAGFAVLGVLGAAVGVLVFSAFPLAFGLGCAPLFVLPEIAAARRDPLGRTGCALAVVGCWLAAACWMLAISFGAAYTAEAISTVGTGMPWSALTDWYAELAKQPGLVCLVVGLMSWPGALEVWCRLHPGLDRFAVHAVGHRVVILHGRAASSP